MKKNRIYRSITVTTVFLILMMLIFMSQDGWSQHYEAYYLYLGSNPDEEETGWSENAQGITHDDKYWYLTQTEESNDESILWKVPVQCDLNAPDECGLGVAKFYLDHVTSMRNLGYDHFGDPDCHQYGGAYYLFIPIEGGPSPAIMVVRCSDLAYIGYAPLTGQNSAAWCAIDKANDVLYGSGNTVTSFYRYKIDWQKLLSVKAGFLTPMADFAIKDEAGNSITLTQMQGGAFSEHGELIYIVAGFYDDRYPNDGITVFDMQTGRVVQRSTNGSGYFNYEFNPGFSTYEEPEGVTVWDVDQLGAPNIFGQLHVILLDNDRSDWTPLDPDDVYLKHYSSTIWVDGAYTGDDENGRYFDPFNTVAEAHQLAWNRAKINIKAGSYPEVLHFFKQVQLLANSGTARFGNKGRISLSPAGMINLRGNGAIKIY